MKEELMESIFPGVETWSWFSEEKQINFNGYLIGNGKEQVVVDPPTMTIDDKQDLSINGVKAIIISNRDHLREAKELRALLNTKVWVPEADAPEMGQVTVDRTFKDGEMLPGMLKAISLPNGKSPGETAFYLDQSGGIMILGDALLGKPKGKLSLFSPDKYADIQKAKEGLRRLLDYAFEVVLVGDGQSILSGGKKAVEAALNE